MARRAAKGHESLVTNQTIHEPNDARGAPDDGGTRRLGSAPAYVLSGRRLAVKITSLAWLTSLVGVAAVGLALLSSAADGQSGPRMSRPRGTSKPVVDAQGNLHVPSSYREVYEFLGTWAIAADEGAGSSQIHDVYATPGAIAAYRRSSHFPEGTVLIKEVYETATAPMTTGTVSHARALKGWFVMVKDSNNSHPGNMLWGNGWGWSWFDAGNPMKTTSTDYRKDCLSCHVPAQATDWVYTSGYPTLK
jgi:Cytochrome P460